ncbi:MAG: hypothetical protein K0S68_1095 [Candidatus Saccharibacteria bacterium]|nr:hypothetical protein [Candidatus Saccharibacteria bacterium]
MALSKADEAAFTAIQENYSQVGTNPKDTAEVTKAVIGGFFALVRGWLSSGGALDTEGTQ